MEEAPPQKHFMPVIFSVLVAITGSMLCGYGISGLSNALNFIIVEFDWCEGYEGPVGRDNNCIPGITQRAFIQCGVFIGATVASIVAGKIVSKGRRLGMILMHIFFFFGSLLSALSEGFISLLVARIIYGIGVGFATLTVPMYISEISPSNKRGFYVTWHQLTLTFGVFLGTVLGYPLKYPLYDASYNLPTFEYYYWRVLLGIPGVIAAVSIVFFFTALRYETPYFMIEKDEANKRDPYHYLQVIYKKDDVEKEYQDIRLAIQDSKVLSLQSLSFMQSMKHKVYRGPIVIVLFFSIFQQLTGMNVLMTNSFKLYNMLNIQNTAAISTGLSAVNLAFSIPPLWLIDKFGRKTILVTGVVLQFLSMLMSAIAVGITWDTNNEKIGLNVTLAGTFIFCAAFAMGYGPIFWVFLHEIFPAEIRASATGMGTAINWFGCIVLLFPAEFFIKDGVSPMTLFIFLTVLDFIALVICVVFIKETKGRSIDDSPYFKGKKRVVDPKVVAAA